jgi:hypothetical protein
MITTTKREKYFFFDRQPVDFQSVAEAPAVKVELPQR